MSKRYEIRTLNDIYTVPSEKRSQMFLEMERAYLITEIIAMEFKARFPKWLHWLCVPRMKKFIWIDDGKQEFDIKVNGKPFIKGEVTS